MTESRSFAILASMNQQRLSLREALETGRLEEFIAEEEADSKRALES
jgi:hypothetical protein